MLTKFWQENPNWRTIFPNTTITKFLPNVGRNKPMIEFTYKYISGRTCVCVHVYLAVPDADEDPRVTKAKFFIRDEFLV